MKILVTGGAGFIGSNISDSYINANHDVTIIDNLSTGNLDNVNPRARFIEANINSPEIKNFIIREKFDIINHQAAQIDVRISVADPKFDAETNILGSLNIYEAAKASGVRKIIFASSGGAIYGEQIGFPALEDDPLAPCSPYGITKLINEKYLFYYKEVFGVDYVALRYANVFGPRQSFRGEAGVVAIFIWKMLTGQQPIINGDGSNTRDYVFIDDVVRANLIAISERASGVYNVGTGIEKDVNFIFDELKKLTNSDCDKIHGEAKKGEQMRSVISYSKIEKEHGWKPSVSIMKGLETTVNYFKSKL